MENRAALASILKSPEHHPEAEGEAFPIFMPRGVRDYILDYFESDIQPIKTIIQKPYTVKQYDNFKLFGRGLHYFVNCSSLLNCANIILLGNETNFITVLRLVKENPILSRISTMGVDHLHRCVRGTLIQIAAMAGDVNLNQTISDKKNFGFVERLKLAGKFSDEEVRDHLEIVTGPEAKRLNEKRNNEVMLALDKFIQGILQVKRRGVSEFKEFKQECKSHTLEFEKDLKAITSQVITAGYVFDPIVIAQAADKFQKAMILVKKLNKNVIGFNEWFSFHYGILRVNGFGMLQRQLSARDSQVVRYGMVNYIEKQSIPSRLNDLISYEYPSSRVGHDFYLNYQGDKDTAYNCELLAPENTLEMKVFEKLVTNKMKSIEMVTGANRNKNKDEVVGSESENKLRSIWSYFKF